MADTIELKSISKALTLWAPALEGNSPIFQRPHYRQFDQPLSSLSKPSSIKQRGYPGFRHVTQPVYTKGGTLVSLLQIEKGLIVDLEI